MTPASKDDALQVEFEHSTIGLFLTAAGIILGILISIALAVTTMYFILSGELLLGFATLLIAIAYNIHLRKKA